MKPLRRIVRIVGVLFRYQLFDCLPKDTSFPFWVRVLGRVVPPHQRVRKVAKQARLRLALQSLGPIFVKLGQLLATRRDVLSEGLALDLAKLQDQVEPFSSELARRLIEKALGQPIEVIFESFEMQPLASASVAQVHKARLKSGEVVVVKVVRPDIAAVIEQDIRLMYWLVKVFVRYIPELKRFHLKSIVQQYEQIIWGELDLTQEAYHTERFRNHFAGSPLLYVPKVFQAYISENVLVMEYVEGVPVNDIRVLKSKGVDLKQLAYIGAEIFLTQVFRDNFFHADMHPGNVHVDVQDPESPRYIALDCAIVGRLSEEDQLLLARQLMALIRQDYLRLARLMMKGGWVSVTTCEHALADTMEQLLAPLLNRPLADIEFGSLLIRLFKVARQFDMQALPQFMLLEKTLIHVEGLGKQLYPNLNIWEVAEPLLEAWLRQKLGPMALFRSLEHHIPIFLEQLPVLPQAVQQVMTQVQTACTHRTQELALLKKMHVQFVQQAQQQGHYLVLGGCFFGLGVFAMGEKANNEVGMMSDWYSWGCVILGLIFLYLYAKRGVFLDFWR